MSKIKNNVELKKINRFIFGFNIVPVGVRVLGLVNVRSIFVGWIAKQDGVPTTKGVTTIKIVGRRKSAESRSANKNETRI